MYGGSIALTAGGNAKIKVGESVMEVIHAEQVMFDDKRSLREVIDSILGEIESMKEEPEETTSTTEGSE